MKIYKQKLRNRIFNLSAWTSGCAVPSKYQMMKLIRWWPAKFCVVLLCLYVFSSQGFAGTDGDDSGTRITSVSVIFNGGQQENAVYRNTVLKAFDTYPGNMFDSMRSNMMLKKVQRLNFVENVNYLVHTSSNGNLELIVDVTLSKKAKALRGSAMGALKTGDWKDFPTLYADEQFILQAKLENKSLLFSNTNAFFGRPDVLTAGNPLATAPSGNKGTDTWLESSVEVGLYGMTAITERVTTFAGGSFITSGSWGAELFTEQSRTYSDIEDAFFGVTGNNTTDQGGLRQFNLLYGRKSFQVDNGMILRLSSANGGERAALQSNPRNAAEQLLHAQLIYDEHKLELFRLDPDELDEVNSHTVIYGINYEGLMLPYVRLGAMLLQVPQSTFSYYTPTATYSRDGLRVIDVRLAYENPPLLPSFYAKAEIARQTNVNFDMEAWAGYGEIGYQFANVAWRPTLSYRYSQFTGDNPDTPTFERWDPLFAGGGSDEWVQGLNQYKVIQTSNVIAHRFMARLQLSPRWELTPQFWLFNADSLTNLGGAQALSVLSSNELGKELNLTARFMANSNLIFVFSTAYTIPGKAIRQALYDDYKNWVSASALMILRF